MFCTVMITFVGTAMMTGPEPDNTPDLARWIPPEVRGWKPKQEDRAYTTKNLFDYIDGGAEVYLSFNMHRMLARRYAKAGAADLIVDLFDMGSAQDAFGVYHHDIREGSSAGIGQESEYQQGALSFWKGPYFASLLAMEETEDSKQAILDLGKALASAIPSKGDPPDIVATLPKQGLLATHLHYFHDHSCLNAHYFLADDNVLELNRDTEGVVARYESEKVKEPLVLLVVRYPSLESARNAQARFLKGYLPDADAQGVSQTENGKWTGVRCKGNHIIGVFDAPSKADLTRRLDQVKLPESDNMKQGGSTHER